MNASLELLLKRRSIRHLTAPAPSTEELNWILQAALQVPDHGLLQPYRFVVVQTEAAKKRLEALLLQAAEDLARPILREKAQQMLQAPLLLLAICSPKPGKPLWEQQLTAGCAVYAAQLAAKSLGYDSFWLSGAWVRAEALRRALLQREEEQLIGIIKVGTAIHPLQQSKDLNLNDYVEHWP